MITKPIYLGKESSGLVYQFDMFQSPFGCSTLSNAVVATNTTEVTLTHYIDCHTNLTIHRPLWLPVLSGQKNKIPLYIYSIAQ